MKLSTNNYLVIALICLFFWEHVANVNHLSFRPTYPLILLVSVFETLFYYIGVIFGHIGSMVTYLHLNELGHTLYYIGTIFIDLVKTIAYIKDGVAYVANMFENVKLVKDTSYVVIILFSCLGVAFIGTGIKLCAQLGVKIKTLKTK